MPEASGGGSDGAAACFSEDVRRLIAGLDAWEDGVTGLATKLRRDHCAATGDETAECDASEGVVRLGPPRNTEGFSNEGPGTPVRLPIARSHITAHRHQHHHPLPVKRSSMSLHIPLASTCNVSTSFASLATASILHLHRSQNKVGSLPAPSFDQLHLLQSSAQPLVECSREPDAGSSQSSCVSTTPSPSIAAMLEAPKAYTDVPRSSADPPGADTRRFSTTASRRLSGSTQKSPLAGPLTSGTSMIAREAVSAPAGRDATNTGGAARARRPESSDHAPLGSRRRALEHVDSSPRPRRSSHMNACAAKGGRVRPTRGPNAACASAGSGGRGVSPPCSTADSRVSRANCNDGRNVRGSAKFGVSGGGSGTGGGSRGPPTATRARSHARDERAAPNQHRRRPQADEPKIALCASSRASVRGTGHSGRAMIETERSDNPIVSSASTVREDSRANADHGQMAYPYVAAPPPRPQHKAQEPFNPPAAAAANRRHGAHASRAAKGVSRARLLRQHGQGLGGMQSVDATNGGEAARVRAEMEERPEERRDGRPGGSLAVYINEQDRVEEAARLRRLLGDLMRDAAAHSVTPENPLVHWLMTWPESEAAELLLRRTPSELLQLLRSGGIGITLSSCHTKCIGDAAAKRLITSLQKEVGRWAGRYDRAVSEAEQRRMHLASSQAKTKEATRSSAVQVAAAALRVHQLTKENDRLHTRLQEFRRYSMRLEQYVLRHHAPPTERDTSIPTTPAPASSLRGGGAADVGMPESPTLDLSTRASPSAVDAEVAGVEL